MCAAPLTGMQQADEMIAFYRSEMADRFSHAIAIADIVASELEKWGQTEIALMVRRQAMYVETVAIGFASLLDTDPDARFTLSEPALSQSLEVYHDRAEQRPNGNADRQSGPGAHD